MNKLLIKILVTTITCLLATVLLFSFFVAFSLHTDGPSALIERYASGITGRKVTIGDTKIQWGRSLYIRMDDLHVGNATWGTEPDMVTLKSLEAVVDLHSLTQGNKIVKNLTVDGLEIFLERDQNGVGNWRFHDFTPSVKTHPFKHDSDQRAGFPVILDATIVDSVFRMKTSSGSILQIDARDLKFYAENQNSPILMTIDGAYNGKRATMTMAGDSFAVLHDPKTPYPAKIRISRTPDTLDFEGTMTDPINMDGAVGILTLNAPDMGEILSMFGVNMQATFPLNLQTPMIRAGDRWTFKKLEGQIADTDFTGMLVLNEGSRKVPDAITGNASFKTLNARRIIDGVSKLKRPTQKSDYTSVPLAAAKNPGITVDVDLSSKEIRYDDWMISNARLHVKNEPGKISIEALKFSVATGNILMDMHLDATGKTPQLKSKIDIKGVDLGRILRLAKNADARKVISGPLNARALLEMEGNNVEQGLRKSRGGIVAYMNDGRISKKFLELASVNLNLLVGGSDGQERMSCLLGVFTMRNGLGKLSPLQLYAPSASLTGGGTVNLLNKKIDVFMQPVEGTTGFLALDVPLHFTGDFSSINIEPIVFGNSGLPKTSAVQQIPSDLLPELRAIAMKSSCIK